MAEMSERTWRTIDERLNEYQASLEKCFEELRNNSDDEVRQKLQKAKAVIEENINLLNNKKEKLLKSPTFLFLIANQFDNQVFKSIPTYVETQDEAKYLTESTMKNLLESNNIVLGNGSYMGIIVRKTYYDKLRKSEKVDVRNIFHNNSVYVTSKVITVSSLGVSIK